MKFDTFAKAVWVLQSNKLLYWLAQAIASGPGPPSLTRPRTKLVSMKAHPPLLQSHSCHSHPATYSMVKWPHGQFVA